MPLQARKAGFSVGLLVGALLAKIFAGGAMPMAMIADRLKIMFRNSFDYFVEMEDLVLLAS